MLYGVMGALLCGIIVLLYAYYQQVVAPKCGKCGKVLYHCRCSIYYAE